MLPEVGLCALAGEFRTAVHLLQLLHSITWWWTAWSDQFMAWCQSPLSCHNITHLYLRLVLSASHRKHLKRVKPPLHMKNSTDSDPSYSLSQFIYIRYYEVGGVADALLYLSGELRLILPIRTITHKQDPRAERSLPSKNGHICWSFRQCDRPGCIKYCQDSLYQYRSAGYASSACTLHRNF